MVQEVKELRLEIDTLARTVECISETKSIHLEKCTEKLLYSKAWLGKLLGELRHKSPYLKDGKRKSVEDIEKTDSVGEKTAIKGNYVERVDRLRQDIQRSSEKLKILLNRAQMAEFRVVKEVILANSWRYSCEARFELGFELERLRLKHNKK